MAKRNFSLAIIMMLAWVHAKTQSLPVFHTSEDAYTLTKLRDENLKGDSATVKNVENFQEFYAIFKKYGRYDKISDSILVRENPFITKEVLIKLKLIKRNTSDTVKVDVNDLFTGTLEDVVVTAVQSSNQSSTWQAAVLDGTAKFLAKRFKEELAAYYLNTFYNKLDDKPVVKALFPRTVSFLRVFANQVYNTDIATLQAAAEEDLKNLPGNLIKSLDYLTVLKHDSLIKSGLSLGLDIYNAHKRGDNFAEIINQLPGKNYLPENYRAYVEILRIFSNSIRSSDADNTTGPWGDERDGELEYDPNMFEENCYYFGLLYEQLKNISIEGVTIREYFGSHLSLWKAWFEKALPIFQSIVVFNEYVLEQKKQSKIKAPDTWEILFRGTTIFSEIFPIINGIWNDSGKHKVPEPVMNVAKNLPQLFLIFKAVQDKRYQQVIPNVLLLLTSLDPLISNEEFVPYMRYAAVLAQFASVETADDMKDLLEAVALPIGSASIKRKSKWNVALNAYVGLAAGSEKAADRTVSQTKTSLGLTAPIGIAISKKYWKKGNNTLLKDPFIPSGTFFLSFFDIGNLVNARLKSDTTSIGDIRFSHFISLGAGYNVNFRNSPFSAGLSWSYVPGYRDIFVNNEWVYKADALRFRFSLMVDIPIFNFYTKSSY